MNIEWVIGNFLVLVPAIGAAIWAWLDCIEYPEGVEDDE